MCSSFGRLENATAGQHEGEAGDALEAAVRARDEHVDACGAVADDEHAALLRDERRERSFEREGAGTRRQDGGVFGGTHARDTQETSAHVLHHRDECGIGGRRTAGHGLEDGCFNGDGAGREQPAGIGLSFHDLQRSFVQSRMRGIIERRHDGTTADEGRMHDGRRAYDCSPYFVLQGV